jgi:hypothetical protein
MKIGYADPPYIGCAHLYKDHPDYAGEVDHVRLIEKLQSEYDGWILHAAATPRSMAILAPLVENTGARWMPCAMGQGLCGFQEERQRGVGMGTRHRESGAEACCFQAPRHA